MQLSHIDRLELWNESEKKAKNDSEDISTDEPNAGEVPSSNDIVKRWKCSRCGCLDNIDKNVHIRSSWRCQSQGQEQVECECGGTLKGHEKHHLADHICWKPYICHGSMIFDPVSTSLFGSGAKSVRWDLGDPKLQNRFEGRCVECGQFGKFNEVAQRCHCSGIMVIQIDHMQLERKRIGERDMTKRRNAAMIKLESARNAMLAAGAVV